MSDLEQSIRERAYHLWQESGQQESQADAHWLEAQREILAASIVSVARAVPKAAKAKATPPKKRMAA